MDDQPADTAVADPDSAPGATEGDQSGSDAPAHDGADMPAGPSGDGGGGPEALRVPLITLEDPRHPQREWMAWAGWVFAGICAVAVFATLSPSGIFSDTTPTGGDMGAHVWGPAFLRDELLTNFRITGWTQDWYAGFPAYVFYMVVPSLLIVWLDVGLPLWAGVPAAAAVLFGAWAISEGPWANRGWVRTRLARSALWVVAVFVAVALIDVPYNIAFKLVAVSGLVTLPLAAHALGRAARLPFPGAPLLALGATWFLFEGGFSILGGNILSTMAGEFAFSISLTFALLYLAVLFRGVETGRDRALAAFLFALVVLNHLIPAIFAVVATVVLVLVRREDRTPWWDRDNRMRILGAATVALVAIVLVVEPDAFPLVGTVVAVVMLVGFDRRVLRLAAVVLPVGGLVAAFWFVPFYLNSPFLNDMGWEKYIEYDKWLWPTWLVDNDFNMANRNFWFALAGAGMVLSLVHRVRLGWFLTLVMVSFGWLFVFLPQYRLWNARLLPFYYLCLYLLAGLAVALVIRALAVVVGDSLRARFEPWPVGLAGMGVAGVLSLVYLAGSLGALPGTQPAQFVNDNGHESAGWTALGITFPQNNANGWASYNFKGLEGQAAYPEFQAMVELMQGVARDNGCGRTMWEYESTLGRFGTPMAPMLLPYFTDGCIGSMEGLYFEASSTTPFHFINQSELSPAPSRAQRDLPYPAFDLAAGVRHLQLMGVRYYLAATDQAVTAARNHPELTELGTTEAFTQAATAAGQTPTTRTWVVFEVANADPVVGLANLPVVLTPEDDHIDGWVYDEERPEPAEGQVVAPKTPGPAMDWYLDPSRWDVPLATSGPANWPRVTREEAADPPRVSTGEPVEVTDVRTTQDSISFRVSDPGTPVLVRTSYFPNWEASGADGPWRVTPNFMVVVPTEEQVTLHYGTTGIDWLAWLLTATGFVALVGLLRADDRRRRAADAIFADRSERAIEADTPADA